VRTKTPAAKTDKEKLAFGAVKTDHMLEIDWDHKDGWSAPRISPYHPLQIDPAASCLHYGLEVRACAWRLGTGMIPRVDYSADKPSWCHGRCGVVCANGRRPRAVRLCFWPRLASPVPECIVLHCIAGELAVGLEGGDEGPSVAASVGKCDAEWLRSYRVAAAVLPRF
jgi:hypothetical protein